LRLLALLERSVGVGLALLCLLGVPPTASPQTPQAGGETIVVIRHGEKPAGGLGQLSCKGLNRSLALPSVLIGRFGTPDFLYAPNPSVRMNDGHILPTYSYLRPLATIEPTAIRLGMPVNTQIGYEQIWKLQRELLQPAHAHSLIFVVWEHFMLRELAKQMLRSYGTSSPKLPDWPDSDFDMMYVFHVWRAGGNDKPQITLEVQSENLGNTLRDTCP